jgi:hypothetical protein
MCMQSFSFCIIFLASLEGLGMNICFSLFEIIDLAILAVLSFLKSSNLVFLTKSYNFSISVYLEISGNSLR